MYVMLLQNHGRQIALMAAISVLLLPLTILVIPLIVLRLPEDYFASKRRHPVRRNHRHLGLIAGLVLKNAVGLLLLVAGVVMLVTPGQGLLTILAGLILMDFPGKYRFERFLVTRRPVWKAMNWLRCRYGRRPFFPPDVRMSRSSC